MMTEAKIMELIEEEDVEFIRLQFTDIFGRLKNMAVTPGQMHSVLQNKYSFVGSTVFGDRYEIEEDLFLYPIMDSFMILPWRPQQNRVAKINCEVCYEDGRLYEMSSRNILTRVLEEASEKGYEFMADPECEFYLFHTDENGLPTTVTHEQAGYMDVGPVDFGENARRDIVLNLEEMGFDIESSHHEHGVAQHEIDFQEADALKIADAVQTFRFAVRSVAKRFGLYATFMPKPKNDSPGSGMHIHLTMMKDDRNAFRNRDGSVSDEARYFMGGLMAHAEAITAIANPTVNSYKRLVWGLDSPQDISWSTKGEKSWIKLNNKLDDTKIELRFPDGSSNPYLTLAVCIAAGLDGINKHTECGPEKKKGDGENVNSRSLPEDLKEALSFLSKDEFIRKTLGEEFTDIFVNIKKKEWNDYMNEVSTWELNRYLTRI